MSKRMTLILSTPQAVDVEIVRQHLEAERGACNASDAVRQAVRCAAQAIQQGALGVRHEGSFGWPELPYVRIAWDAMVDAFRRQLSGSVNSNYR